MARSMIEAVHKVRSFKRTGEMSMTCAWLMYCAVVSLAMLLRPLCDRSRDDSRASDYCHIVAVVVRLLYNNGVPALSSPDYSLSIIALKKVSFTVNCPFCGLLLVAIVQILHTKSVPVELGTTEECSSIDSRNV
jgi:hypothetical protein